MDNFEKYLLFVMGQTVIHIRRFCNNVITLLHKMFALLVFAEGIIRVFFVFNTTPVAS